MPDSNQRSPLTLEDLLRLKRAERPPPEFWARFESELRQKQLAALLEIRPWWQTLPHLITQRRMYLPLGATAIVAFALLSVGRYSPERITADAPLVAEKFDASFQPALPVASLPIFEESTTAAAPTALADANPYQNAVVSVAVPLSEQLPEHAVELTPWSAPLPVRSPSAKLFAANVEQLERDDPRLKQSLANNPMPLVSSRLQRSGGAVAELASVSALASKRTRLLAQFGDRQFAPEPQAPANIRERLTRRMADTNFTERYTRLGLKGDQVSLKF